MRFLFDRYSKYTLGLWSRLGVPHPKPTLFLGHAKLMKDVNSNSRDFEKSVIDILMFIKIVYFRNLWLFNTFNLQIIICGVGVIDGIFRTCILVTRFFKTFRLCFIYISWYLIFTEIYKWNSHCRKIIYNAHKYFVFCISLNKR
jgi:hypothetical protein